MSGSTSSNVIGSGSDSFTLNMAEDQQIGTDAQFTVNVDGQQIGGVQTVTASQSAGQTEPFTFAGNWGPGQHDITVTFANNWSYPGSAGDRNVYVDGVTYDGQTVSSGTTPIYQSPLFPPNSTTGNNYGNASFTVNDTTPVPAGAASTPTTTPAPVTVGSGPDRVVLNMAEDPYQGDAQFTVSVDGQQVGGVQTTTANIAYGQSQEFDVQGNFGSGTHNVAVTFLNDKIGGFYPPGTPGLPPGGPWAIDNEDRNLYVLGASLNGGAAASGAPWELSNDGTQTFSVTAGSNPSATAYSSGIFGADGAAVDNGNPAIPSGSSSGMSFISTPAATATGTSTATSAPTTATSGTTTSDPTAATSGTSGSTSSSSTTPTVASVASGTTPTTQDFSVPASSGSASSTTPSTSSGNGNWWMSNVASGGVPAWHNGG